MSDEILQTLNTLINEIEIQANVMGWSYHEAFFEKMNEVLTENGDVKSLIFVDFERIETRGLSMRADGYHFEEIESSEDKKSIANRLNELTIVLADYNVETRDNGITNLETFNTQDLERKFNQVKRFIEACSTSELYNGMEPSSPDTTLVGILTNNFKKLDRINLHYVTTSSFSGRLKEFAEDSVQHIKLNKQLFDINRYHALLTSQGGGEPTEITFDDFGFSSLVALQTSVGEDTESMLLAVPGQLLFGIYEQYGARLLEQNVRTYLQARGNVNKGMIATLVDNPSMFFSYNNGLTATASQIFGEKKSDNTVDIRGIKNLQIVNGGQTTASIHYAKFKSGADLSKVFVQMKLSVVDPEKLDIVVPKIAQYANTQNKVNAADFFANHPFHRTFEELSRKFASPKSNNTLSIGGSFWYYERARGAYANETYKLKTKAQKDAFILANPKSQLIKKEDLAKALMSFEGFPDAVSKGGQAAFIKHAETVGLPDDFKKQQYKINEFFFKHSVAKVIIFRELEKLIIKADWYEGGGSRACTITYSIAWFAHFLKSKNKKLDFGMIWKLQTLSAELRKIFESLTPQVYEELKNSTPENLSAVPQWAKRKGCWDKLKLNFDATIDAELLNEVTISEDLEKWNTAGARGAQKKFVAEQHWSAMAHIRTKTWQEIYDFVERHEIRLDHDENTVLSRLKNLAPRPSITDAIKEKESKAIYPLFEKLEALNFPFHEHKINECLYK